MSTLIRRMLLSFTATLALIVSTQAAVQSSYAGRLPRKEAAMSNSGGKITAPVSIEDVCQVLGVTTRDVGYLCSNAHGKINMWSKCKPVHIQSSIEPDRSGKWWRGSNGTCGLQITPISSYYDIPSKYTSDSKNGWGYTPPSGGASSPYRLVDFNGYKHNSAAPIRDFIIDSEVKENGIETGFLISDYMHDGDSAEVITLEDINAPYGNVTTLSEYSFGMVITETSGTIKGRVSSKNNNFMCKYDCSNLVLGRTYYAYPFFSALPIEQNDTDSLNRYFTVPNVRRKSFKIISEPEPSDITINITAAYIYQSGVINSVKVNLSISSNYAITLSNNYLFLRYKKNMPSDAMQSGEKQVYLGNITISRKGTYTNEYSIPIDNTNEDYFVYLTLQSGKYTKIVMIIEGEFIP